MAIGINPRLYAVCAQALTIIIFLQALQFQSGWFKSHMKIRMLSMNIKNLKICYLKMGFFELLQSQLQHTKNIGYCKFGAKCRYKHFSKLCP